MVICLERGADLHIVQLMPLPLTVSCFSKIQIGFTFLVLANPGSPGQTAVKRVCVCTLVLMLLAFNINCSVAVVNEHAQNHTNSSQMPITTANGTYWLQPAKISTSALTTLLTFDNTNSTCIHIQLVSDVIQENW